MTNQPEQPGTTMNESPGDYRCECGAWANMGIMSLVARCPNCPRVYACFDQNGRWFANIDEANAAYHQSQRAKS
jgi:hypothetical protein